MHCNSHVCATTVLVYNLLISNFRIILGQEDMSNVYLYRLIHVCCTSEYCSYGAINFSIPHFLHLKQHLPELLGNPAPELQGLHGPLKIHLWIKEVLKLKFLITREFWRV